MGCAKVLVQTCHVQSLQRTVPKVLFFLPRALDSTDLLTTLRAEGRLPFCQPLITTSLQPAPPALPHHGLQGPSPKQGSVSRGQDLAQPAEIPALPPRAGTIPGGQEPSAAHSSAALTSHLSPRKLCLLSPPQKSLPSLPFLLLDTPAPAQGLSCPAAAHWTVTFATPLTRQGYPNPEFYCSFATGYLKDGILFFKMNCSNF